MILRKACPETEIFPRLLRGSNAWPLALKDSVLTTRLPRIRPIKRRVFILVCVSSNFVQCESQTLRRPFVWKSDLTRISIRSTDTCNVGPDLYCPHQWHTVWVPTWSRTRTSMLLVRCTVEAEPWQNNVFQCSSFYIIFNFDILTMCFINVQK